MVAFRKVFLCSKTMSNKAAKGLKRKIRAFSADHFAPTKP